MFLRKRNNSINIERSAYTPAVRDAQGKVIESPKRSTEYVGSIRNHTRFCNVPHELLAKLDDTEMSELKETLKGNEPQADYWLANLPGHIQRSAHDLTACAATAIDADARKALEVKVKAVHTAWDAFFKTAQGLGLKRAPQRKKKAQKTTGA